jgi:FKBP-type peptidyl-prolyl cis-trans isomerase 2
MTNAGKKLKIHYKGTLDDGEVFDSSYDRGEPLEFVCGSGQVIEGFDEAVKDMAVGDKKSIHLEPEQAYGEINEELIQEVPLTYIPNAEQLPVGKNIIMMAEDGSPMQVKVVSVNNEVAVFDMNHPMAGKALNFELELVAIEN